jgi:signal transduction histidine kinase
VPAIGSEAARLRGIRWAGRRARPRWTLRLRLTLLYGGLFLAAGAVLLAITYELVAHSVTVDANQSVVVKGSLAAQAPKIVQASDVRGALYFSARPGSGVPKPPGALPPALRRFSSKLSSLANAAIARQRQAQLDALLTRSGIALGIMAFVSIGLGWLMAGRALRPLRTMSTRARGISERNLHERLALEGPDDELKELGDTFDGLLARLETAFESQRRFVANASHELRTPITVQRTVVEVAIADPQITTESLRDTCERVLRAGEEQERLIEALLTLARSQRGLGSRETLDLGAVVGEALHGLASNGITVRSELGEAVTAGDPALVERLVANLLDNALHHNASDGWVSAWTGMRAGRPTVRVVNTGPVVPLERSAELLEPFRRLNGERSDHARGLGLGLSIVGAIATAHGAELQTTPRAEGGLEVEVAFPVARMASALDRGRVRNIPGGPERALH